MNKLQLKELTTEELKKIQVEILDQIDDICKKEGIKYTLIYGTLLGAVRHEGFIPWDDDIDIAMERSEYNRFIEYCKNNPTPFDFKCHELDKRYGYLFGKACDKSTLVKEHYGNRWKCEYGVYVDIFPIDALANTKEESENIFDKTRFRRELLVAANWRKFFRSKTKKWYYEPIRFAFFLLSRFVSKARLISKIEKAYVANSETAEYSAIVCGAYRKREIMKSNIYRTYGEIEFEGKTYFSLSHYDEYLSTVYKNYMQLPPEEKRVSHHTFTAYWK